MRAFIAAALYPLAALCIAQPFQSTSSKLAKTTFDSASCISAADAVLVANGFGQILSNFNTSFGDILIADGYTDQSDSVSTLMHSPNVVPSDVSFHPLIQSHLSIKYMGWELSEYRVGLKPHVRPWRWPIEKLSPCNHFVS